MHLMFDLDGTLVDSAPTIRYCLLEATKAVAPDRLVRAAAAPIGPPLTHIARMVFGELSENHHRAFVDAFSRIYDDEGVQRTHAYPGVSAALRQLAAVGARLSIVTNKRERPTLRIVTALGWEGLFSSVLCTDSPGCGGMDKAARIASVVQGALAGSRIMIGDTVEDYQAAAVNQVAFVAADYGYERDQALFATVPAILRLATPSQLAGLLRLITATTPPAGLVG